MRLAWLTDIHLNFLPIEEAADFIRSLAAIRCDALAISGDLGEAPDVVDYLERLDDVVNRPIYFVLGNHDFYHGSIAEVRARVVAACAERTQLRYLSQCREPLELSPTTAIIGHDGWADGRLGNYEQSLVRMTDWQVIDELRGHTKLVRWPLLQALADEAATHLRATLRTALKRYPQVFVVTHVPPFKEACWHEGRISDDQWLPHFTSKAVGDVLLDQAKLFPHRQITVLCGHTHGTGHYQPLRNLHILTGGATYTQPSVQRIFELE